MKTALEAEAPRNAERPGSTVVAGRGRFAEAVSLNVRGWDSQRVPRPVRVRPNRRIEGEQFVVVGQVVPLDLQPRPQAPPDWDVVVERQVEPAGTVVELGSAAGRVVQRPRRRTVDVAEFVEHRLLLRRHAEAARRQAVVIRRVVPPEAAEVEITERSHAERVDAPDARPVLLVVVEATPS